MNQTANFLKLAHEHMRTKLTIGTFIKKACMARISFKLTNDDSCAMISDECAAVSRTFMHGNHGIIDPVICSSNIV